MMFSHGDQPPFSPLVIDRTRTLLSLFEQGELSASAASALIGAAKARTLGHACELGRKHLLALPRVGRETLDELTEVATRFGLAVRP